VPATQPQKRKDKAVDIGWVTVTYRSVFLSILGILALAGAGAYFAFPEQTKGAMSSVGETIAGWLGTGSGSGSKSRPAGQQKAQFTMIDGTVKVKKKNSNSWVTADYNLPLEKGDVVQTSSEGMAKIVFADLTNYTVKQDSLIVVEENSTTADEKTNVAVQVTTGTVDLSTATYSQGSKSQVIVAGATATLQPESVAQVRNDPRADQREILVTRGGGEVSRGGETVSLSNYEKVSFKADSPTMTKSKEIGPPILIDPSNMLPVFAAGNFASVRFSWTPVENSTSYHVRVSKNAYFTQLLLDRRINAPELTVNSMPEGAYYWSVQSVDVNGKTSIESERNRFTVIPRNTGTDLALSLDPFVQHGRIIEVKGKTDSSARVMVNGNEVPYMNPDGSFRYLTPPLPNGENMITVTAQNAKGAVNTKSQKVVIQ
jgi:hypothetical protein